MDNLDQKIKMFLKIKLGLLKNCNLNDNLSF